jgi:hypothetical protein
MKRLLLLFTAIALTGAFSPINALDKVAMSDKGLSNQYKQEIKTIKVKLEADRQNSVLKNRIDGKTDQLKDPKSKKIIINNAIKSKIAAENAVPKAEKAKKKAEKAVADAQRTKEEKK